MAQKHKQKKMGIGSGLSRTFNLNGSLTPTDVAILEINGQKISRTVSSWIHNDAVILLNALLEKKLHLARNAFHQLLEVSRVKHPEAYMHYIKEKRQRNLDKYLTAKIKRQPYKFKLKQRIQVVEKPISSQ